MAGDSKDVELRIRAVLDGKKSLTETVDALKDLAAAQDQQLAAAKRGEASAKSLQKSYEDLAKVAESLVSKAALTRDFESQANVLSDVRARVDAAREAQTKFAQSLGETTKLSREQASEQNRLANAVKSAERAQLAAENRVATLTQKLADYGISASNVAGAQTQIRQALDQTEQAMRRQDAALRTLDADLVAAKTAAQQAAKAEAELAASAQSAADALEREARSAKDFQSQRQANAELIRRVEYERLWVGLLDQREAAERQAAKAEADRAAFGAAMRAQKEKELATTREQADAEAKLRIAIQQTADAAAARARGASTLARPQTAAPSSNIAGAIQSTVSPNTLSTLQSVEEAVQAIERRAAAAVGPVRDFAAATREAETAQRTLVSVARQVDAYRNQITALRGARAEFVQAREAVAAFVQQMRAGTGGPGLANDLTSAQARLAAAAREMANQTERARGMREQLRAAGVSTRDLAAVQQQLQERATRSVAAMEQLTAAVRRYGTATGEARREGESLYRYFTRLTGERTTLSYFQRLRGEVLGLATAFVGVTAAVDLAKGSLDIALSDLKVMNGLTVVFNGNQQRAREEFDYLREAATRIQIPFDSAAKAYTKLAIAATAAGKSNQETRYIFESFANAGAKLGQSGEEMERMLKAVEQMLSKGSIKAEELTQQLGDVLPGAVTKMAKATGRSVEDLLKMMEQSALTVDYVLNFSKVIRDDFNITNDSAAAALQKAISAQKNAADDFKRALGASGFIEAYTKFLTDLTAVLRSPEGKKFAKDLGGIFGAVSDLLRIMVNNLDLVKAGLEALLFVGALSWAGKMATAFRAASSAIGITSLSLTGLLSAAGGWVTAAGAAVTGATSLGGAVGLLTFAFKSLLRAIPIVGAVLIAWDIGQAIFNKFKGNADKIREEAKKLQNEVSGKITDENGKPIVFNQTDAEVGIGFADRSSEVVTATQKALKTNEEKLRKDALAAKKKDAKDELEDRIRLAQDALLIMRDSVQKEVTDELKKAQLLKDIQKQLNKTRQIETDRYNAEHARQNAEDAERQIKEALNLAQQLESLSAKNADKESKIDPGSTFEDRLNARRRLVENTFKDVRNKIDLLDKMLQKNPKAKTEVEKKLSDVGIDGGLQGARKAVADRTEEALQTSDKETAQKEVDRLEKRYNEIQSVLAAKIEAEKKIREAGVQDGPTTLDNIAALTARYNVEIEKAGEELGTFATKYQKLLEPAAFDTLMARIAGVWAGLNAKRSDLEARLADQEAATNRVLDERKRLLDEVKVQQDAQIITSDEAARRTNAINDQYRTRILANVDATLALVDALRKIDGMPPEALASLDATASKLQITRTEIGATQRSFGELATTVQGTVASGISSGLDNMFDGVLKVATGVDKSRSMWDAFRDSALAAISDVLKQIGLYILKMELANSLASSSDATVKAIGMKMGGTAAADTASSAASATAATTAATTITTAATTAAGELAAAGTAVGTTLTTSGTAAAGQLSAAGTVLAVSAAQLQAAAQTLIIANSMQASAGAYHVGGVVGSAKMSRSVSPFVFSGAPRFHSGGLPGLARDEVPTILQKGEEVLTRNDPRHVLNGGGGQGGGQPSAGQRFVLVDDRSKVAEAMASAEGEQVTMLHLKRNIASVRQLIKG